MIVFLSPPAQISTETSLILTSRSDVRIDIAQGTKLFPQGFRPFSVPKKSRASPRHAGLAASPAEIAAYPQVSTADSPPTRSPVEEPPPEEARPVRRCARSTMRT